MFRDSGENERKRKKTNLVGLSPSENHNYYHAVLLKLFMGR